MPSKKKKYNARFPPARIKKIMQSDEEVGKVAQAVPVIISRALELFVESLLKKAEVVTQARNAKTLTPSHLKQCIMSEHRFDFLRDLVSSISDVQGDEDVSETLTPRPTPTSDQQFIYQSQTSQSQGQGPSTSSLTITASGSTSAGTAPGPAAAADAQQQQQFPPEISEFMMSLPPNQQQQQHLQQHYIKQEDIKTKPEQIYMPMSTPNPNSTSIASSTLTMTSGHHHYPIIQPHGVLHNPYIPAPSSSADSSQHANSPHNIQHPHPQHPHAHEQPQQHPPQQHHFYYSQYDNSNGKVKMEDNRNDGRLYSHSDHVGVGEHPGYEFNREHTHHY